MMVRRGRAGTAKPEVIPLPQGVTNLQYNGCSTILRVRYGRLVQGCQIRSLYLRKKADPETRLQRRWIRTPKGIDFDIFREPAEKPTLENRGRLSCP